MLYDNLAGLVALSILLQLVSIAAVALRFVSRHLQQAGYDIDDWLIVVSLFFTTGLFIIELYGCAKHAFGVRLSVTPADRDANDSRLGMSRHLELAMFIFSVLALSFVKISTVFLFRRIFSARGWFGVVTGIYIGTLAVRGVVNIIATLAECGSHLLALFGSREAYTTRCNYAMKIGWGLTISDAITNLLTILLPLPMVWRLNCSTRRKLEILAVFATGLVSVGASSAKAGLYIIKTLGAYHEDVIIVVTQISVWTYVEIHVAIFAACALTFRPVLLKLTIYTKNSTIRRCFGGPSSILPGRSSVSGTSEKENTQSQTDGDSSTRANSIVVETSFTVYRECDLEVGKEVA